MKNVLKKVNEIEDKELREQMKSKIEKYRFFLPFMETEKISELIEKCKEDNTYYYFEKEAIGMMCGRKDTDNGYARGNLVKSEGLSIE